MARSPTPPDTLSDQDRYPPCPDCETDVFVAGLPGKPHGQKYVCHFCGRRWE